MYNVKSLMSWFDPAEILGILYYEICGLALYLVHATLKYSIAWIGQCYHQLKYALCYFLYTFANKTNAHRHTYISGYPA